MRILVCGSRDWTDEKAIRTELEKYTEHRIILITGGCRGADTIASKIGTKLGFTNLGRVATDRAELVDPAGDRGPILVFEADWGSFGRSVGRTNSESKNVG